MADNNRNGPVNNRRASRPEETADTQNTENNENNDGTHPYTDNEKKGINPNRVEPNDGGPVTATTTEHDVPGDRGTAASTNDAAARRAHGGGNSSRRRDRQDEPEQPPVNPNASGDTYRVAEGKSIFVKPDNPKNDRPMGKKVRGGEKVKLSKREANALIKQGRLELDVEDEGNDAR